MKVMSFEGIEEAKKPIFFCSFGKDSSVVLHGLREGGWLDKTLVVFVDCGGVFPDIVEWAQREGANMPRYFHLHAPGDIWEDIRKYGWSTDVEIADLGRHSNLLQRTPVSLTQRVRPWTQCTYDRFWMPGFVFTQMYRPDLYISGEKQMDRPYANDWETRTHGVQNALRPVFDWSDEDVWEYIDAHGIELAPSFRGRQPDRRDCYLCFGHDLTVGRVQYLKDNFPELYDRIFNQEGFAALVPHMVEQLEKTSKAWKDVQELLEEDNGRRQ